MGRAVGGEDRLSAKHDGGVRGDAPRPDADREPKPPSTGTIWLGVADSCRCRVQGTVGPSLKSDRAGFPLGLALGHGQHDVRVEGAGPHDPGLTGVGKRVPGWDVVVATI
jgi:hypothetical protein